MIEAIYAKFVSERKAGKRHSHGQVQEIFLEACFVKNNNLENEVDKLKKQLDRCKSRNSKLNGRIKELERPVWKTWTFYLWPIVPTLIVAIIIDFLGWIYMGGFTHWVMVWYSA